jgi:hypothetical protein
VAQLAAVLEQQKTATEEIVRIRYQPEVRLVN